MQASCHKAWAWEVAVDLINYLLTVLLLQFTDSSCCKSKQYIVLVTTYIRTVHLYTMRWSMVPVTTTVLYLIWIYCYLMCTYNLIFNLIINAQCTSITVLIVICTPKTIIYKVQQASLQLLVCTNVREQAVSLQYQCTKISHWPKSDAYFCTTILQELLYKTIEKLVHCVNKILVYLYNSNKIDNKEETGCRPYGK